MVPRRARLPHLEPARRALAEGRYEAAFALLEDAASRTRPQLVRALYQLHLAAADALYGRDGLDHGLRALRAVASADPAAVRWPLYRALHWEFRALQGASAHEVRRGVARLGDDDPVAAYHAASALWCAGASRAARRALSGIDAAELPAYLRWRRASLLGHANADADDWEGAAAAFAEALETAAEAERETIRVHLASALLELGRVAEVRELLATLEPGRLTPPDLGWGHELRGRAELELGNPGRALIDLDEADRLAEDGIRRFAVAQARAQALARLGRHAEAADRIADALPDAPEAERAYALHERAIALLEADRIDDARETLEEILLDPDYPYRGEVTADLAEIELRRGDLAEARETAARALDLGATGPACLTLGTVAFEYFDLDEAVVWLERAVSATTAGDPTWIAAHQLLADVYAQRGPSSAENLLIHARKALSWTEGGSEWAGPLEAQVELARSWLGGHERWLN